MKSHYTCFLITLQLMINLFVSIYGSAGRCEILMASGSEAIEGQVKNMVCMPKVSTTNIKYISWYRKNVDTKKREDFNSDEISRHNVIAPQKTQSILKINPVNRGDGDYEYICSVEYYENNKFECGTRLTIKAVPGDQYPECNVPGKAYTEGEVITISCRTEYLDTVHLNMSKDKILLEENLTRNKDGNEMLLEYTFPVTVNNSYDNFACEQVSENDLGKMKNCTFPLLNVNYAPRVKISYSGKKYVSLGSEALLACTADSNPVPFRYSWTSSPTFNHNLETNGLVYRIKVDRLSMNGTVITCTAHNTVGRGESNYTLIVVSNNKVQPSSTEKPLNRNVSNLNGSITDNSEIKLLMIAGASLFLSALLIIILFCYLKQRHILYMQSHYIAQPEVYFEPKDSVRTHPATSDGPYWGRNVGIQVPPDPDKDSEYAEIEEARKSGSNKSV